MVLEPPLPSYEERNGAEGTRRFVICFEVTAEQWGSPREAGAVFSEPYDHAASCRITPNPNALSQAEH